MKIKTTKPIRLASGPVPMGSEISVSAALAKFFVDRGEAIAMSGGNSTGEKKSRKTENDKPPGQPSSSPPLTENQPIQPADPTIPPAPPFDPAPLAEENQE